MIKLRELLCCMAFFSSMTFGNALSVEPYREAQLVKSQSRAGVSVEIPLSKIRRAGRGWEPESIARLDGDVFSSLYKINRNSILSEVYSHYRSQMLKNGQRILFECDSRSCGSSNAWANDFFHNSLLYGADQNQYLLVVKNQQDIYQVMYLNRRGTGDVMVRLDEAKSVEAQDTEFQIVAQMDVKDIPRIRRFVRDLSEGQSVVGFVTSNKEGALTAIESGDKLIATAEAGLGDQLKSKVRFINLADLGRASLGINRVSFVYVSR